MYELHISDGCHWMHKYDNLHKKGRKQGAMDAMLSAIKGNPNLKWIAIYKVEPGFHSTVQHEYLVSWYEVPEYNGYYTNIAKLKPHVAAKKLVYNVEKDN